MDPQNSIEVKNVKKEFSIHSRATSIKDLIVYRGKEVDRRKRTVLHDINFNVKKGESVGIIGRNGSGKSTTLKLLTRILRPDEGTIETDGKISCLIELGAGFHPDMTGRENVYINASIFGITHKEVNRRLEDIIEFSGIRPFIDERVRNYSSGMYLRLAFAVAINVDADILLIDEILAVGDVQFQQKCVNKLQEMKENGVTTVFVTHDVGTVKRMCNRVIWIDDGCIREDGPADEVCDHYIKEMCQ